MAAKGGTAAKKSAGAKGKSSSRSRSRQAAPRAQNGPTSDRIREIQEALAKGGHYHGAPTGRMDASTAAALTRFQQANNLEVTGKLSAMTLKRLEKYGLPGSTYAAAKPPDGN